MDQQSVSKQGITPLNKSDNAAVERRSGSNHHQSKTWLSSRQEDPVLIALAALTEGGWIPMVTVQWLPCIRVARWAG